MAINMLASVEQGLVASDRLKEFLSFCAKRLDQEPGKNPIIIIEDVSCGENDANRRFLRQCRSRPFADDETKKLSNTMNSVSFHRFVLNSSYKSGKNVLPVVLPPIPVDSESGIAEYRERLSLITKESDWKALGAMIGRPLPEPANCWITSDHFGIDKSSPLYQSDPGTQARDELGLIDNVEGDFLLRLNFLAKDIASICEHEMARPVFSDLGNRRFRVYQSSSRAIAYARDGWGATMHLGKFRNTASHNEYTGACERVSSALPLESLSSLTVELIGKVKRGAGEEAHDNDDGYAEELLGGRDKQSIKAELLKKIGG